MRGRFTIAVRAKAIGLGREYVLNSSRRNRYLPMRVRRIISGGQTGVDRGALDAAIELGIEHGGWCPPGRRAEDGIIPGHYLVAENPAPGYSARTERNVVDSDATLILAVGPLRGGTQLTRYFALEYGRPLLVVQIDENFDAHQIRGWLAEQAVEVLNIAGPRESQAPGIQAIAKELVRRLFVD